MKTSNKTIFLKLQVFEYICHELYRWYEVESVKRFKQGFYSNDLNKLKLMKLLFFVCAASCEKEYLGLLEIFNNFYALPLGHVESDVYDNIGSIKGMVINRYTLELNPDYQVNLTDEHKQLVQSAIAKLKDMNPDIILYSANLLVTLSHLWNSWQINFRNALMKGKNSHPITVEEILVESKIFKVSDVS